MKGALGVLLILGLIGAVAWRSIDVSATTPHSPWVEEFLHETMEAAVRRSAADIEVPPLSDPALLSEGAHHYFPMCEGCHAGPGVEPSEMAKGLYPPPPALHEEEEWSDAELFWIVKNGIKGSGMPAYGPSHSDEELWGIIAFVRTMPGINAAAYEGFRPSNGDAHDHGAHGHGDAAGDEGHGDTGHDHDAHDHSTHAH